MSEDDEHKLVKSCIPKGSGVVTFVIEPGEKCKPRCEKAESI